MEILSDRGTIYRDSAVKNMVSLPLANQFYQLFLCFFEKMQIFLVFFTGAPAALNNRAIQLIREMGKFVGDNLPEVYLLLLFLVWVEIENSIDSTSANMAHLI